PCGGFGDPAQDLQQRAFARPVAANYSNDLARLNGERNILQCPDFRALAGELATFFGPFVPEMRKELLHLLTHGLGIELPQLIAFGEVLDLDNGTRHGCQMLSTSQTVSTNVFSILLKTRTPESSNKTVMLMESSR